MFGAKLSTYLNQHIQLLYRYVLLFLIRPEIMKVSTKIMFFKKRYIFGKKIFVIQKIFEKKKFVQTKREKKNPRGKKIIFLFFM